MTDRPTESQPDGTPAPIPEPIPIKLSVLTEDQWRALGRTDPVEAGRYHHHEATNVYIKAVGTGGGGMTADIWHNRYTGPRWTYAYRNRPMNIGCQPGGFILASNGSHPCYRHGTIDYPVKLSDKDVYEFELVLVRETPGTTGTETD